ncbi:hypothetical protein TNCV_2764821 [Trichonephila clavipes]|nr:hypothetical protein TNCV_2764821 [Trichonephila clavipes]
MPQQLIDTLILSMGRRCETCLAVRGDHIPLLKTGCFLLDTHHRDVSAFSLIALHATFSIKLLFIPLISLLTGRFLCRTARYKRSLTFQGRRIKRPPGASSTSRGPQADGLKFNVQQKDFVPIWLPQ